MDAKATAKDERVIADFIKDLQIILGIKALHIHTRRSILYKTMEEISKRRQNRYPFQFWSEDVELDFLPAGIAVATDVDKERFWNEAASNPQITLPHTAVRLSTKNGYHLEHPIPMGSISNTLVPTNRATPTVDNMEQIIHDAFSHLIPLCWVRRARKPDLDKQKFLQNLLGQLLSPTGASNKIVFDRYSNVVPAILPKPMSEACISALSKRKLIATRRANDPLDPPDFLMRWQIIG